MQVAELNAKLKIDVEYTGDPAALRYLNARAERRFRYIALFGTWLVALAIAWLALGCGAPKTAAEAEWPAPTMFGRSDDEKEAAAVRVENLCMMGDPWGRMLSGESGWGSGVIYDNELVYTAFHVVRCPPKAARMIHVVTPDGVKHWAELESAGPGHDIARLRVAGLASPSRVTVRMPTPGEQACIATAHPERRLRCGKLDEVREYKTQSNGLVDIWHEVETDKGNSGSGIYDLHGYLIGLTTNSRHCEGETLLELCGLGTSLKERTP